MARGILQAILLIGGAAAVGIALMLVIGGGAFIVDAPALNASMDSEIRFYATMFGFYGAALLWCVKDVGKKSGYVRLLAFALFAGGVARTISIVAVGLPHPFFIFLLAIELIVPVAIFLLLRAVDAPEE